MYVYAVIVNRTLQIRLLGYLKQTHTNIFIIHINDVILSYPIENQ